MQQLIIFEVGSKKLALPAHFVTEIIRVVAVTELPHFQPPFVGIINYRGKVVPVLQVGLLPGFHSSLPALTNHMILVEATESELLCLIVDQVCAFIKGTKLQPVNVPGSSDPQSWITPELVEYNAELIPVLAVDRLFRPEAPGLELKV